MTSSILSNALAAGGPLSVIAAMITPAFLILSAANLIASTLTRLARIVDTARTVMERKRKGEQVGDSALVAAEVLALRRYASRAGLVQISLASFYTAIGLFVASSIAIALAEATRHPGAYLPVWLTIAGAVLLFAGSMLLLAETTLATRMLRVEISAALE